MKCISYVSKVTSKANGISVPTGLSEIFRASRKKNAILGVSGILSYRNGYYIQILEGPANSVDQIYEKIKADNRHTNVTLLFETSITERSFPQWSMKLLQSVKKDVDFVRFIEKNSDSITTLNKKRRELLNIFYSNGPTSSRSIDAYSGNNIMLLAWPDLTVIKPSPVVIELCARLTKTPHPYNSLLSSNEFGTKQQLDKILNRFESLGILKVSTPTGQPSDIPAVPTEVLKTREPNRFYSKMKSFLGML